MQFRELQIAAPRLSPDVNVRLSVLSEVAYHVIQRTRPDVGFVKLVVEINRDPYVGDALVPLPGGLRVFRVLDDEITEQTNDLALRRRVADHVDRALDAACSGCVGPALADLGAELKVELIKPPPYEFELRRLTRRDPVSRRTLALFHRFDKDQSQVVLRSDDPSFAEQTIASAPFFIDLGGLFRATRSKIVGDRIVFNSGREPIASAVIR